MVREMEKKFNGLVIGFFNNKMFNYKKKFLKRRFENHDICKTFQQDF